MGAINPTKLTDWLQRREPVWKWFQEGREGGKFWEAEEEEEEEEEVEEEEEE